MSKKKWQDNPWKAFFLVSGIGLDLAVCTVLGFWVGKGLAYWFGGHPLWIAAGVLFGIFLGFASVIVMLKPYAGDTDE